MIEILLQLIIVIIGSLFAIYLNSLIIVLTKADKYENNLIERIAKRVVELQREENGEL